MPLFNNFPYTNFHEMNLDFILNKVKEIDAIKAQVSELLGKYNDMYNRVNDLSSLYDNFAADIQADLQQWEQDAAAFIVGTMEQMNREIAAEFANQWSAIDQIMTRMDHLETTVAAAYYIDSPFTGERVPMQEVIYQLASLHTTDALTAAEYDAADLTAAAYDALDLTAYAYDWNGATYIS